MINDVIFWKSYVVFMTDDLATAKECLVKLFVQQALQSLSNSTPTEASM